MARMNPKRRLLAKIKVYDQMAREHNVRKDEVATKLQQGSVRSIVSSYSKHASLSGRQSEGFSPDFYVGKANKRVDQRSKSTPVKGKVYEGRPK